MKKIWSVAVCCLLFASLAVAANQDSKADKKSKKSANTFGEAITKKDAVAAEKLLEMMDGKEKTEVKITGKINEVCKVKGCWMTVDLGNGKNMRVTFKDYGFFVPKDAGGKTFWAEGEAKMKTTSVEMLRHYAEDAGKSKEEIAAITEPKKELIFVAKGVIVE